MLASFLPVLCSDVIKRSPTTIKSVPCKERPTMQITEIKTIAKQYGIKVSKLKKTELIKQVQLAEGNVDCFATPAVSDCGQEGCLWRADCLKAA